ncbi:hypothetical protein DL96DRAFT_1613261 [Flagelloscypha sp. PMI_526]|nr:hypothetical protein DL96DRAFT_1613261 [Flagelloscypha sp. PMI_526]
MAKPLLSFTNDQLYHKTGNKSAILVKVDADCRKKLEIASAASSRKRSAFFPNNDLVQMQQATSEYTKALVERERSLISSLGKVRDSLAQIRGVEPILATLVNLPPLPIPALPTEVLRITFRESAWEGKQCGATLSLVSKQVQSWVDPILFQRLKPSELPLLQRGFNDRTQSFDAFLLVLDRSPRLQAAMKYSEALSLRPNLDTPHESLKAFLALRPSIWTLSLFKPMEMACNPGADGNLCAFPSIKHLHVYDNRGWSDFNPTFKHFQQLTALSLTFVKPGWSARGNDIVLAVAALPRLCYMAFETCAEGANPLEQLASLTLQIFHLVIAPNAAPQLKAVVWRPLFVLGHSIVVDWKKIALDFGKDARFLCCLPSHQVPIKPEGWTGAGKDVWPFLGVGGGKIRSQWPFLGVGGWDMKSGLSRVLKLLEDVQAREAV